MITTQKILIFFLIFTALNTYGNKTEIIEGNKMPDDGIYESLKNGDLINVRIVEEKVYAYFLNPDRTLKQSEVATILFDVEELGTSGRIAKWRAILKPSSPLEFVSSRGIYPPYKFFFRLIIRYKDGTVESITRINYNNDKYES